MATNLINIEALISSNWVDYAKRTIADHEDLYCYYIHKGPKPAEIGGGPYGTQVINTLRITDEDEEFIATTLEKLDKLIDLDFKRTWEQSEASTRYFLDSEIDVGDHSLAVTTTNGDKNQRWFEIILDGSQLTEKAYRRYATIHEYGHTLGLEHPFDDEDGDSVGGTNPWTSSIFPEDTVMAYRRPMSGEWPQSYSASDIKALTKTWGLEDDHHGCYLFSRSLTGEEFMIGDPTTAKKILTSEKVILKDYQFSEDKIFGTEADDILHGLTPSNGGWTHEWFYSGSGSDLILAGGGRDQLLGGMGDDTLRGGHGQDVIEGGFGDDQLYGGGGRNTLIPGNGEDEIFVLSDHVSHGDHAGRNHGGDLADVLVGVENDDRITILGCKTSDLEVKVLDEGYGIEAGGVLEAIILDSEITKDELRSILSGDSTRWF